MKNSEANRSIFLLAARLLVADVLVAVAAALFGVVNLDVVEDPTVVGLCGLVVVAVVDVAAAVVDEVSSVIFGMAMGKVNMEIWFLGNGKTL